MSARECLIRHIAATERQKRGSQEEFDPCLACDLAMKFREEGNMSKVAECVDCKKKVSIVSHERCWTCLRKAREAGVVPKPQHRAGTTFKIGKLAKNKTLVPSQTAPKLPAPVDLPSPPITVRPQPLPPAQSQPQPEPVKTTKAGSEGVVGQVELFRSLRDMTRSIDAMLLRDNTELDAVSCYLEIASADVRELAEFLHQPFVDVRLATPLAERAKQSYARYTRAMQDLRARLCGIAA